MSENIDFDRVNRRQEIRRQREKRLKALYIGVFAFIAVVIIVAVLVGSGLFFSGEKDTNQGNSQDSENVTGTELDSETETGSVTEIGSETEGGTETENGTETEIGGETYVYLPQPEWDEQLLTPNEYSRPQKKLETVNGIVLHYVGNPGSTAKQNRDYFEDLAITHTTSASSHFVVGLSGEIIQCIPLNEVAYASRHRNYDTISIEICHPTAEGWFNEATYDAVIELTAWLVVEYDLEIDDVIRHYDVTGKECPKYYVDNESAWEQLKEDVQAYITEHGEIRSR